MSKEFTGWSVSKSLLCSNSSNSGFIFHVTHVVESIATHITSQPAALPLSTFATTIVGLLALSGAWGGSGCSF
jgi:hypothetical protein